MSAGRAIAVTAALALQSCAAPPPPPAPDPTGLASADMLRVLTLYLALGAKPVEGLTVASARAQPTIYDAAAALAPPDVQPADSRPAKVSDISILGASGTLPARLYDPRPGRHLAPVILYFHGGGWATGTLDSYDASARALSGLSGAMVLSVGYRLAPEAKFPAAHDDAAASYRWLLFNGACIGADPKRVALAGEGAGGNLAIDTAIWARDHGMPAPVHELLIYPEVGTDLATPSYNATAAAVPLNRAAMQWYVDRLTNGPADLQEARLNVIGAADLRSLPPTTIVSAQIDPLRSEGEALAEKLQGLGTQVEQRTYPGVTHGFFGMGGSVAQAAEAEEFAAMRLRASFGTVPQAGARARHHARHHHPL